MDKSQSSIEYIVIFTIFMSALILTAFMSIQRTQNINEARLALKAESIVNEISEKINMVVMEGDGFQINLTLPSNILGSTYNITIASNSVALKVSDITYIRPLLTSNITGVPEAGTNLIRNDNGEIVITKW